ncbi:MAG: energy transducer TonB [Bacteroidales bacterium]|nr:energy transducer TonB [Bacteroidales bacterium]
MNKLFLTILSISLASFSLGSPHCDYFSDEDDGLPSWLDSLKQVIMTQDTRLCGIFAQRNGAHNVLACMQHDSLYVLYYLGADVETGWNSGDVNAILRDTIQANTFNAQWILEDKQTTRDVVVHFTEYYGFYVESPNHHKDYFVKLFPKRKYEPQRPSVTNPDSDICSNPDVDAEYPGGANSMFSFISSHLSYPRHAWLNNISGRVFVSFVVDTDGTISDVEASKKINPALDAEAVRVVKLMPKWKPATKNGKPVRVSMVVPINFYLMPSTK